MNTSGWPFARFHDKTAALSSTDHGGGKQRVLVIGTPGQLFGWLAMEQTITVASGLNLP
jgi:hypothetical protein